MVGVLKQERLAITHQTNKCIGLSDQWLARHCDRFHNHVLVTEPILVLQAVSLSGVVRLHNSKGCATPLFIPCWKSRPALTLNVGDPALTLFLDVSIDKNSCYGRIFYSRRVSYLCALRILTACGKLVLLNNVAVCSITRVEKIVFSLGSSRVSWSLRLVVDETSGPQDVGCVC